MRASLSQDASQETPISSPKSMTNLISAVPISAFPMRKALEAASVKDLVHNFYDDILEDVLLGPIFVQAIGPQWDAHLERMVSFWSTVMLGTHSFRGNVFGKHMALKGQHPIQAHHFYRWLTLWHHQTSALFEPEVARDFQRTAQGIARNLFYGLLGEFAEFIIQDGVVVGHVPDASANPPP